MLLYFVNLDAAVRPWLQVKVKKYLCNIFVFTTVAFMFV